MYLIVKWGNIKLTPSVDVGALGGVDTAVSACDQRSQSIRTRMKERQFRQPPPPIPAQKIARFKRWLENEWDPFRWAFSVQSGWKITPSRWSNKLRILTPKDMRLIPKLTQGLGNQVRSTGPGIFIEANDRLISGLSFTGFDSIWVNKSILSSLQNGRAHGYIAYCHRRIYLGCCTVCTRRSSNQRRGCNYPETTGTTLNINFSPTIGSRRV